MAILFMEFLDGDKNLITQLMSVKETYFLKWNHNKLLKMGNFVIIRLILKYVCQRHILIKNHGVIFFPKNPSLLGKRLLDFVSPNLKLHNRYCHRFPHSPMKLQKCSQLQQTRCQLWTRKYLVIGGLISV